MKKKRIKNGLRPSGRSSFLTDCDARVRKNEVDARLIFMSYLNGFLDQLAERGNVEQGRVLIVLGTILIKKGRSLAGEEKSAPADGPERNAAKACDVSTSY